MRTLEVGRRAEPDALVVRLPGQRRRHRTGDVAESGIGLGVASFRYVVEVHFTGDGARGKPGELLFQDGGGLPEPVVCHLPVPVLLVGAAPLRGGDENPPRARVRQHHAVRLALPEERRRRVVRFMPALPRPARRPLHADGATVRSRDSATVPSHDGLPPKAKQRVLLDQQVERRALPEVEWELRVAFAQIGIIGFDGQIEVEALRLYGLPEDAPAILSGCPALPAGGRTLMFSASWDLPSMPPGATTNADVTVPGARRGDFADASLDTSSIAFVLDCHVWSNDKVRVTARNVSLSTVDLPAAPLHVQVVKRRVG